MSRSGVFYLVCIFIRFLSCVFFGIPWKRGEEEAWWICRCQFWVLSGEVTHHAYVFFFARLLYSIIIESKHVDWSMIMYGLHWDKAVFSGVLSIGCSLSELSRLLYCGALILDYKWLKMFWFVICNVQYGRNRTKLSFVSSQCFLNEWVLSELLRLRYCGAFILDYEWFKMGWFVIHNV